MSNPNPVAPEREGFPWLLTGLSLLALAVLLALGTWQVNRLAWKNELVSTIDSRINAPPLPLAEVEGFHDLRRDIEYMPVVASGRFDHAHEQYFFATHNGQSGWYVYTPLALSDGRHLFVNRGFVPYDRREPAERSAGQVEGTVEIVGLARSVPAEKPSWLVPENQPEKNTYYWKDLAAMTARAGLDPATVVPFYVDAARGEVPGGLPVGGVTMVSLPNSHLQYAVTWYGLAAALIGVYVALVLRRRRPERAGRT